MVQEDARTILKQAGVKERMAYLELATLQTDFYTIMRGFLADLSGDDKMQMESVYNSIVMARKSKIIKLAEAGSEESKAKMTPEECQFFDAVSTATILFRESVL